MSWSIFLDTLLRDFRLSDYDLSKLAGISAPTFNRIRSGKTDRPYQNTIKKIEEGLNIRIDDRDPNNITYTKLEQYAYQQFTGGLPVKHYPVVSEVFAGEPSLLFDEDQFDEFQAFTYDKKGHHCFAVRVNGKSMETTLKDGDIVLCDFDVELTNNCLVAVRLKNGNQYIKRYKEVNNDFIHLSSDNGNYSDRVIAKNDIEVIARVVEGIVKYY